MFIGGSSHPSSAFGEATVVQMGNHQNLRPDRCPDGLEAKPNRPVQSRAASPDLGEDDMEEWECQSTGNQNPGQPVHTTRPRMPAEGTTTVASPKAELGMLDPPMNIEKSQRVRSYS